MIRADSLSPDVWASMCTPMHEIIPSSQSSSRRPTGALYLGSWMASVDGELLNAHAIRAIVEVHDSPWGISPLPTPGLERSDSYYGGGAGAFGMHDAGRTGGGVPSRYKVAIADSADVDVLKPHLEGAVRHIRERLSSGENVLVHCQQGISRSTAIVIAYLMRDRGLSYDAALRLVKAKRMCVKPNAGFERTLRTWEAELRAAGVVSGSGSGCR